MTLKDINQFYRINRYTDGSYLLYDLNQPGRLTPYKYVGNIRRRSTSGKFEVNGTVCSTLDELRTELHNLSNSYPFDIEYYNPNLRVGLGTELIVSHWMRDIGFSIDTHGEIISGSIEIKNPLAKSITFNIEIVGLCADYPIDGECTIVVNRGEYTWSEYKCKHSELEIISTISNVLRLIVGVYSGNALGILKKLESDFIKINPIKTDLNIRSFEIIRKKYTEQTIQILENLLKSLKDEKKNT